MAAANGHTNGQETAMSARLKMILPMAAVLAAAAFAMPAQAGVSWSIGINAPIVPGVHVGTVIGGGHAPRYYAPPVVYAPVYAPPPVVYAPRPVYAPVVYGPPAVVVAPRPVYRYYRAPVVVRPAYVHHHHHHHHRGHDGRDRGNPGRGGYEPMSQMHTSRVLR